MSSSLWTVYVVFLGALLSRATAQAPGDREAFCDGLNADISPPPEYPANAEILMDSYNYHNLLTLLMPFSSVWQQVDNDNTTSGDGVSPVTWLQSTAISCRQTMSVWGFAFGKQDNWLITQHISRVVNGIRLPQVSLLVQFELKGFNEDETSCIALLRVIVFYHVCPAGVFDRVIHPEMLAPIIDHQSPPVEVTTTCVTGASPENEVTAKITCAQGGVWNAVAGSGCLCNSGLVDSGDGQSCIGCPASQYRSMANNDKCRKCPSNSMNEVSGLPECPCVMDYCRRPEEADLPCTKPPGLPTNAQVVSVTSTAIYFTWDPPEFAGGRNDIRYTISYWSQPGTEALVITTNATFENITGLDPNVCYKFFLSATNGVSSLAGTIDDRLMLPLEQTCPGLNTSDYNIPGWLVGIICLAILLVFSLLVGLLLGGLM